VLSLPGFLILEQGQSVFAGDDNVRKDEIEVLGLCQSRALAALSHTVASWPAKRKARDNEAKCWLHHRRSKDALEWQPSPLVIISAGKLPSVVACVPRRRKFLQRLKISDSSITKVVPRPGSLRTLILPPWSLTTDCTIARPARSVLFAGVIRSEDALALSAVSPEPVSATSSLLFRRRAWSVA